MNQLPFFSKSQRRALLLLEWFLILLVLGIAIYQWKAAPSGRGKSLVSADSTLYNNRARTKEASPYYAVPEEKVETFPFDPNTADSTELLRLGLSPWQVRAIYRYRAKHGRYHTPEDFQRLPGMTVEQWERLGPYVRIAERFRYLEPAAQKPLPKSEPLPPADTTKTVVQPATVPVKKSGPKRSIICLLFLFLAFLATTAYIIHREGHLLPFFFSDDEDEVPPTIDQATLLQALLNQQKPTA